MACEVRLLGSFWSSAFPPFGSLPGFGKGRRFFFHLGDKLHICIYLSYIEAVHVSAVNKNSSNCRLLLSW